MQGFQGVTTLRCTAAAEPDVTELSGIPEYFADGAVVRDQGEVVQVMFYRRTHDGAESTVSVVMPRSSAIRSGLLRPR